MPTYQYACTECGHDFEQFQSFTDEALTECPACEGKLRKVFNAVGVVFKGSGFYRTDSRNGSSSSTPAASSSTTSSTDSSSSSSTTTTSTKTAEKSTSSPSTSSSSASS